VNALRRHNGLRSDRIKPGEERAGAAPSPRPEASDRRQLPLVARMQARRAGIRGQPADFMVFPV